MDQVNNKFPQINVPVPPPQEALLPSGRKNLGKGIGAAILIIALLGVGFGSVLATRVWDPLWNPFRLKPEKVMAEMTSKMRQIKALHSESKITLNIVDTSFNQSTNIVLNLKSNSDEQDPSNLKSSSEINVFLTFPGASEAALTLKVRLKAIGENLYAIVDTLDSTLLDATLATTINLNQIKGQWVKIDPGVFGQLSGASEAQISVSQPKELFGKIQKIFSESKIYSIKKELADSKINGKMMYRYQWVFNNDGIINFFLGLFEDTANTDIMKSTLQEMFVKIGEIGGEILIGKNDYLLYGLSFTKDIDMSKLEPGQPGVNRASGKLNIKFETNMSNFNNVAKIEAPLTSVPLEQIITPILARLAVMETRNKIIAAMDNISSTVSIAFASKKSYWGLNCANKDIKPLCDEIKGYTGSYPVIHYSVKQHCAYIKLPSLEAGSTNGLVEYYCASASVSAGRTITENPGLKYCNLRVLNCGIE